MTSKRLILTEFKANRNSLDVAPFDNKVLKCERFVGSLKFASKMLHMYL